MLPLTCVIIEKMTEVTKPGGSAEKYKEVGARWLEGDLNSHRETDRKTQDINVRREVAVKLRGHEFGRLRLGTLSYVSEFTPDGVAWYFPGGDRRYGMAVLVDKQGEIIKKDPVQPRGSFSEGLCATNEGYMDTAGKIHELGESLYEGTFNNGVAKTETLGGDFVFIDRNGKTIYKAEEAKDFSDGLAAVKTENGWNFIDTLGKEVFPDGFEKASSFNNGVAAVKKDGRWIVIDKDGRQIPTERTFTYIGPFNEGLAWATDGKKAFLIDAEGQTITSFPIHGLNSSIPDYYLPQPFHNGWAVIKVEGYKKTFINPAGLLMPESFSFVEDFNEGVALITDKNNDTYYIDADGRRIEEFGIRTAEENMWERPVSLIGRIKNLIGRRKLAGQK